MNGLLIINKPKYYSSMDVIRKLRRITGIKKIGHAGTLDPLATGVLLVCIGTATKKINLLMDKSKEYIAEIDFTCFSETDDAEGQLTHIEIKNKPTNFDIELILKDFIGDIYQTPPKYSALKIQGLPAYKRAINGEEFTMKPRLISINSIDLISYAWPKLKIKVHCGKGTYIRSLARDIGTKLNTGGYLTSLIRTAIGEYQLTAALDLTTLSEIKEDNIIKI